MQCLIFVFLIVLISCDWSDESYGAVSVLRLEEFTNSHVSSSFANNYSGSFKAKMYGNNPYFFLKMNTKREKVRLKRKQALSKQSHKAVCHACL